MPTLLGSRGRVEGGAAVPRSLIEGFQQIGVRIVQGWGMTETSPLAALAHPPRGVELGSADDIDWRAKTGRVIGGVELRIVDDAGEALPWDGEAVGEIEVRAVLEASVVGIPDERWSERPLACVVLVSGASVTAAELQGFLASDLAKWQLPENWAFIEAVPKTSVGKFDKKVLRARQAAGELDVQRVE